MEKVNNPIDNVANEIRARTEQENNQYWRDKTEKESSIHSKSSEHFNDEYRRMEKIISTQYEPPVEHRMDLLPALLIFSIFFGGCYVVGKILMVLFP